MKLKKKNMVRKKKRVTVDLPVNLEIQLANNVVLSHTKHKKYSLTAELEFEPKLLPCSILNKD